MHNAYAPGCALLVYKPDLAGKILDFLKKDEADVGSCMTCCHVRPQFQDGTQIINTCAGCDRRYRSLYQGISTVSLWEVLAKSSDFPFPDYGGVEMAIHDPCPVRTEARVHNAVRELLGRMHIKVVEPGNTRDKSICCGDSFYGELPVQRIRELMKKRAGEMPREDVVVYCVSCIKSMHIGGRKPRHMVDLLFSEATFPGVYEPDAWHAQLDAFIERAGL